MGLSLITEYPFWLSLLCLLAGGFYAFLLYRRSSLASEVPAWQLRLMAFARFALVSILAFLLLGPMLRSLSREVEKPIIVLGVDHSLSVLNGKDSLESRKSIEESVKRMQLELGNEYEVKTYAFGDHVRESSDFQLTDKETDFTAFYDVLDVNYLNRNVGAVVLVTDGIYNAGMNPVYGPAHIKVPVYALALGDTAVRKDLLVAEVRHNKVAFLGNSFPLEVAVDARQCSGSMATLTVKEDSTVRFTRNITLSGNNFHTLVPVLLVANTKGIHRYEVSLNVLDGEVTSVNNRLEVFVEVVENKQKVLLLANAPHPDLSALKFAIENSPNYEVKTEIAADFDGRPGDYSLVILHNLPSLNNPPFLDKLLSSDCSRWIIQGASTRDGVLESWKTGVSLQSNNGSVNDVLPSVQKDFSLFSLDQQLVSEIGTWPPLKVPFGIYQANGEVYPLLNQRIGSVESKQPLLWFSEQGGVRQAVLAGEGLWRWRLADFSRNGNHDKSNDLISKVVQYLSVKSNRSPFRVNAKTAFKENEMLVFDAELHNQSDELTNEPDVRLTITNRARQQFPFVFSRNDRAYYLNAGQFPVGKYRYKAETKLGDKLFVVEGEFSVNALQLERANTVANHQLLNNLAQRTGGMLFQPGAVQDLIKAIQDRPDVKSVSYTHQKLNDLIHMSWVFILLMALLTLEWFLRKRGGSY